MKKIFVITIILLLFSCGALFYIQYNKAHRNTAKEEPAFEINATSLFKEFEANENVANEKYLDKLLLVSGTVGAIVKSEDGVVSVTLQSDDPLFGVSFELLQEEITKLSAIKKGQEARLKGICTGKLMDVVLVRSVVVD